MFRRFNNKGIATSTLIIIFAIAIVILGGSIGGVLGYDAYRKNKNQEEVIEQSEVNTPENDDNTPAPDLGVQIQQTTVGEKKPDGVIVSETVGSGYGSWQAAYRSYVESINISPSDISYKYVNFDLINLDDDGQPELWITLESEASGERVATYDAKNDQLKVLQLMRQGSQYIPNKGLVYNNCGHMDYYPIYVYKLYQNEFYKIGEGEWGALDSTTGYPEQDSNGNIIYQFEWEGIRCTEDEMYRQINDIYNLSESTYPNHQYVKAEMINVLSNH